MTTPTRPLAGLAEGYNRALQPTSSARTARQPGDTSRRAQSLTRRYEVSALLPNGDIDQFSRVAPATPVFEDAFAAFARGTLIATAEGPVAVEDLVPGAMIETVTAGPQPLLWVGAMTVFPESASSTGGEGAGLTRLATDALGFGRPQPDLVLGPRARILYRAPACRDLIGVDTAFAPARAFVDGDGVIPLTPVSPVRVFHLCLEGQQVLRANGMEVESYHPGIEPEAVMTPETAEMFLSLFPNMADFSGFGPLSVPRLTAFEAGRLRAA